MVQIGIVTMSGYPVGTVTWSQSEDDSPVFTESEGDVLPGGHHTERKHARHGPDHHDGEHHRHGPGHFDRTPKEHKTDPGNIPYSSSGNPFDRSRFAKEMAEKPWLRERVKRISLGENQDPRANASVIESMMNRAIVRGTSLEAQAKLHRSSGYDEGGYYAGYRPNYSRPEGAMADQNIDRVLAGSNITNYATDNSSGDLAARERATGAFQHHTTIAAESFFSPGHAEPAFRDRWEKLNRQAIEFEHSKTTETAAARAFDPETEVP